MLNNMSDLGFDEVEGLRQKLGLSQTRLCQMAAINPTTYQRWLRHARGQPGGNCPHPRSLAAVHSALCGLQARRTHAPNAGDPEIATRPDQRDSRRDGTAGNAGQAVMSLSGTPDRAA